MQLATVVSNIKSQLEGWSWTSTDGGGSTSFQEVYTNMEQIHEGGYPFAVIWVQGGSGEPLNKFDYAFTTQVSIYFCVNWAVIDNAEEIQQREEAQLRLLEIWDYAKTQMFSEAFRGAIGVDIISEPNFDRDDEDDANLFRYRVDLNITEDLQDETV